MVLAVLLLAGSVQARSLPLQVRLCGDRITIRADQTPLGEVLREIARGGVTVKIDPRIESYRVSGSVENEDLDAALEALLTSFAYVISWEVVDGPVGPLPKLKEMQVFLPGEQRAVRALPRPSSTLAVTTGPGGGSAFVQDEILLGMKPGTTAEEFQRLVEQLGGTLVGSIPELGVYRVLLARGSNVPALIEQLKRNPLVAEAEPNYVANIPSNPTTGEAGSTASMPAAPAAPGGAAVAAILDSGLMASSGLGEGVVGAYDALDPDRALTDAVGHGTQMAMITAGAVQPADASAGATDAEGVPIVAIRAFDENGNASYYGLMRSIDYALKQGARVVNMSWGSETDSKFLSTAIAYAQSKGLIVVAAAGNAPTGRPVYPAAYSGVVGVGAVDQNGRLWNQSNYGSIVALTAPGMASFPIGHNGPPGSYAGTSISSAYVTRALALYLTRHPKATRQDALTALRNALTDAGAAGRDNQYGYGVLDSAAIKRLLQ
ncbi:MAG: hypothetical protein A2X46_00175 [Lentisphaerae bacterium GWF2_57_35]|nr:MAG: hypothetical protein A2X46_00175 [Lentisphaerae bacterium GWF2_57_35]